MVYIWLPRGGKRVELLRLTTFLVNMSFESLANSGLDSTQIKVGVQLALGTGLVAVVTDVSDEGFVIDANPPLAGASYLANVKLISVEPGPGDTQFSPESSLDSKFQVATFALGKFNPTNNRLNSLSEIPLIKCPQS